MADIAPFPGYRYNLDRVRLDDVVTQPYDKISTAMQERYLRSSPYNLISVEKGKAERGDTAPEPGETGGDATHRNVYTRAERALEEWISGGILVRDADPGIYVYSQEYTVPGSPERRTRKGFIALGRLEDYSAGVVFRHEYTLAGPKVDRLELLRHTGTHTGQLFMLYTDPERRVDALLDMVTQNARPAEAHDEYDVVHRLWPVFDRTVIADVVAGMTAEKLVIADGHHRYETALAYRNECRERGGATGVPEAPYERAMMTFFNTRSEGLLILPTHRVVANLARFDAGDFRRKMAVFFDGQDYTFGSEAARAVAYDRFRHDLVAHGQQGRAIGMYVGGEFTIFTLRPEIDLAKLLPDSSPAQRELDVVLLHRVLLERGLGITPAAVVAESNIIYEREMTAAVAAVDDGSAQIAFLLNPVVVEQVTEMALDGEVMPQKSTDFYPKLLSGLTLYRLD